MLRRVKMCTVQCQFDVMCASIVLEPKENEDDNAAPYNTFSWHGLSRPRLYVSIFPFHNPRWLQNSTSPPLHNHLKKNMQKHQKKPSPPHHFFKVPHFSYGNLKKIHGSMAPPPTA